MSRLLMIVVSLMTAFVAMGRNVASYKAFYNINLDASAGVVYYSLCRDSTGMMWFGTNVGLCRYDGYHVRRLDGMASNTKINCMVASDSMLYAGTDAGMLFYDLGKGEYAMPDDLVFPFNVRSMVFDKGYLWIGSLTGLYCYDIVTRRLGEVSGGLPHKAVYAICLTHFGDLYAGTHDGLCRYDRIDKKWIIVPIDDKPQAAGSVTVNALADDARRHCLWIGTEGALYRYDYDGSMISADERFAGQSIKSLAIGRNGDLVVGTGNGLVICNERRVERYRHDSRIASSLSGNEVWSVMTDCDGNLWTGTDSGVSEWVNEDGFTVIPLYRFSGRSAGNRFYTIFRDSRGYLWLGGTNGLLRHSPGGQIKWYRANDRNFPLAHNRVHRIYEDSRYELWIATDGGISRYDYINEQFINYTLADSPDVHNACRANGIVEDRGGMMWVGSCLDGMLGIQRNSLVSSAARYDVEVGAVYNSKNGFPGDMVTGLAVAQDGSKWVMFHKSGKLVHMKGNGENEEIKVLDASNSHLQYIVADSKHGGLWCGHHNGITYMSSADTVGHRYVFPSKHDIDVYAMEMVRGNLWISTSRGVWVLEPEGEQMHRLRLPERVYTSIYNDRASHKVLLGGNEEVVVVDPSKLPRQAKRHEITITAINVDGQRYIPENPDVIKLAHGQSRIIIEFSDFDYNAGKSKKFEFRIGRNNDECTILTSSDNSIEIAGMAPGSYVLEIRILDSMGDVAVKTLKIDISPAWYASWWAITAYVLSGVLFVLWILNFLRLKSGIRTGKAS